MKIIKLTIENFLTVGEKIELELDNKGLILVTGENRDDTSTISNGAGKSTIGDAVCWALYGATARGESGDSVVNNKVGKNCRVELLIEDSGAEYSIARHRKDKTYKNSLQVFNVIAGGRACGTKGTDKLTQELVNKIIGCSYEVFRSAVYCGQDSIPNLPGLTDKNLKEIVEEAAGINRLSEAHAIARDELKAKENSLLKITADLTGSVDKLKYLENDLLALKKRDEDFKDDMSNKLSQLNGEKVILLDDRLSIKEELDAIDSMSGVKKLADVEVAMNVFLVEKKTADDVVKDAEIELSKKELELRKAIADAKMAADKFKSIESRVGEPCEECGKAYCEDDIKDAAAIAKEKFYKLKQHASDCKTAYGVASAALSDARDGSKNVGDTVTAVNELKARRDAIRDDLTRFKQLSETIDRIDKEIERVNKEMSAAETSPYEEMIEKRQLEIDKEKTVVELYKTLEIRASEKRDLLKDAVGVFSPSGVRAHIIDTVTPFLNDRTSHYLSTLSDGNISAVWNTLSKTKAGELREKFVIEVGNDKGASSFGGLSGGEKRKVRIATSLALQDLVASRASKPFPLFIADEIDDALDVAGLERLMMLLEEKAREKGTVLLISHNDLADWVSSQITVVKEDGFSRIEAI